MRLSPRAVPLTIVAILANLPMTVLAQQCIVTKAIGPADDLGTAVVVQPDGRILLSGYASNGADDDFAIVRYNRDFTLDQSFGLGGVVTTPIGGGEDRSEAMALQPDGKIVVAGHKNSGVGNNDFAVVRYNIDGSLDTTFNPGGGFGGPPNMAGMVVTAITGGDDEIEGVAIQPNGKIVVAGFTQRATLDYVAARYNTDGSLDTAGFNSPNGYFISTNGASDDAANAVAIQPSDGKIVLAGWAAGLNDDFAVVRLNTNGTFDGAFGNVLVNFPPDERDRAHSVLVQPDDKILVSGEVRNGGLSTFGAARLDPTGAPDGTFGTGGKVATSFTAAHDAPFGMVLQSDDHIVLGGYTNWTGVGTSVDFGLLRYDDLGNPDNSFDSDSKVTTDIGGDNDWIDALALQSNGKVIAGGYSVVVGNDDFALARYNVDGSIDTSCTATSYRSIGTNGGILYNTGTASVTGGTDVVTFSGGASLPVPTAVGAVGTGDVLILNPGPSQETSYILSRDSDTRVTLQAGAMATHTNVSFEIRRAYTTLQDWEDAHDGDLVGENRREFGVAYKDGSFVPPFASANAALLIEGSITDADHFMALKVATGQRHGGIAGGGVVVDGQGTTKFGILDQDDYTRIDGLELTRFKKAGDAGFAGIVTEGIGAVYERLLIHDFLEPTVAGEGVRTSAAVGGWSFTLRNSIIYDGDRSGVRVDEATSTITVDNVTVYNMESWGVAIGSAGGTATVTNTISMNNGTASFTAGSGTLNQAANISSDATAMAAGSLQNRTATDNPFPGLGDWVIFEDLATMDLHLQNSAENDALDGANDLSPTFSQDVDTQLRSPGTWDYGADELVCQVYYGDEASPNAIGRVDLDGSRQKVLFTNPTVGEPPRGLALDVAGGKMYWAEGGTKIRSANLDGSNVQDLVIGLSLPRDIDLDVAAGKMYWTDSSAGTIQSANLDGTGVATVISGLSTPRGGPALDLTAAKMYWTEDGTNRIRSAKLDGTGLQDLMIPGLSGPFGIAVDPGGGKVYWTDYGTSKIQRANLDGSGVEDLVTAGLSAPRGIALDLGAGKMYWVDYNTSKLSRANLDGTVVEDLLTNLGAPNAIDLGCNISPNFVTTAVEIVSFTAAPSNGAVELSWETGAEMQNLGFHLYRAESSDGPYERITATLIPGLGSSPAGASYRHFDSGLVNGRTYYYQLEDVETTGRTERHGPVSASPSAQLAPPDDEESSLITYGDPASNRVEILRRSKHSVVIRLRTEGFFAFPRDDGTVAISVPDFDIVDVDVDAPGIPVRRLWIDAIAGRQVEIVAVSANDVEILDGLRPASIDAMVVKTSAGGELQLDQRRRSFSSGDTLYPEAAATIADIAFQGDVKKALLHLAPLRWDPVTGRSMLAKELVVRLVFRGRERGEWSIDGVRGRRPRKLRQAGGTILTRLVTETAGLHGVTYEDVFGRRGGCGFEVALSRRGEPVPYHLVPEGPRFAPGSKLYFLSEGAEGNPHGNEAVYELTLGEGARMDETSAAPSGPALAQAWRRVEEEQNRIYQPTLFGAPDRWLWDMLFAPTRKSYSFHVVGWIPSLESARLRVRLQGATDLEDSPDHHVRVYVNGTLVDEVFFDGKRSVTRDVSFPASVLASGSNALELENAGDTGAPYSMVMLDRFTIDYPSATNLDGGVLEATWSDSGSAVVAGGAHVVDLTGPEPVWARDLQSSDGSLWFHVGSGRRYLTVASTAVFRPRLVPAARTMLRRPQQADYLVIGPAAFLEAARPLAEHRAAEGLSVRTASVEDIVSEFGYGEHGPDAIRDFIAYAYHEWPAPSLRYVLLVGDATYDPKHFLGADAVNDVPSPRIRTRFLWTASDLVYAAVNGEDDLPDVAIGRLPASSTDEVRAMVKKILDYESASRSVAERIVLVADNPDDAGDFVAHAEELGASVLAGLPRQTISLESLGAAATKRAILDAFDDESSLMSYLGHGGIHLWADEMIFQNDDVAALASREHKPILLTMNCLNGYFHFPFFDSLAEELMKPEDRGVVAAFSPSGLSLDDPAHQYHEALLEALLSGEHARLGDAVLAAQKTYVELGAFPELLRIYHLFGDPALSIGR